MSLKVFVCYKAGSKNSTQKFISFLLFSSLPSFSLYLADFAYSFSRIVHYAPSTVNEICQIKAKNIAKAIFRTSHKLICF